MDQDFSLASPIARSMNSGSLPFCDGGIPRGSSINLQVDNHFLEFRAIGLAHLVLHERLRILIPYLVVQNALRISHVLDQRSFNECLLLHNVCEDFPQTRGELCFADSFIRKRTTRVILSGTAISFEWNSYLSCLLSNLSLVIT